MAEPTDRQDGFSAEYTEGFSTTPDTGTLRSAPQSPSDYEEVRLRGGAVA
jgi:hypothetical protein